MSDSLQISSSVEYAQVSADNAASIYVNCHLVAPSFHQDKRKPVDIVVVLDRSRSMSGKKINLCKETLTFLADQLSSDDRVSLVTYNKHVTTNLPLTKMNAEGKRLFKIQIRTIMCRSGTNLSGGMMTGLQEIQQSTRVDGQPPNPVQSVLLLTDGLANIGVHTTEGIVQLLEGTLSTNVSLFTFGYGSDHDSELLRQLSDLGRGSYYYIQNAENVSLAFADCLGGLLSVAAQSIKASCSVLSPGVAIKEVKTIRPMQTVEPEQHYEIDLGDMYAEEERDILLRLALDPTSVSDSQSLVQFSICYANVLTSSLEKATSTVTVRRPQTVTDKSVNVSVVQQKHRIQTAETIKRAQTLANAGNLTEGQAIVQQFISTLEKDFEALNLDKDNGQEKALLSDLQSCVQAMMGSEVYQHYGQYFMQCQMQAQQAQRSNEVNVSYAHLASEANAQPSSSAYRNSAKRAMLMKAMEKFSERKES